MIDDRIVRPHVGIGPANCICVDHVSTSMRVEACPEGYRIVHGPDIRGGNIDELRTKLADHLARQDAV